MVGQGHFCKPINFFGRNYLPFINRGTTLNNRSLVTSMTVCFESCGTGDTSFSIVNSNVKGFRHFLTLPHWRYGIQFSLKMQCLTHFSENMQSYHSQIHLTIKVVERVSHNTYFGTLSTVASDRELFQLNINSCPTLHRRNGGACTPVYFCLLQGSVWQRCLTDYQTEILQCGKVIRHA